MRHAALAALVFGAIGCQLGAAPDPACEALLTTTRVQYVGHAFGRGEITLRRSEAVPGQIEGGMILRSDKPEDVPLQLAASGTCKNGVARMRLAGANHPSSDLRILGGRFVMIEDAELFGHRFGMWRVEVITKSNEATRELHGYFREKSGEEAVIAKQ
jgi:hypothetical protein